jgi:hypothetical protein
MRWLLTLGGDYELTSKKLYCVTKAQEYLHVHNNSHETLSVKIARNRNLKAFLYISIVKNDITCGNVKIT